MNADINVTSLVDVAFTLLVIFIITAPILQGGVEVDVPRADVQPLTAEDDPFFVTVMRDGTVYMENTETTVEDFATSFAQLAAAQGFERVYLRADSLAPWGPVLKVIATLSRAEVVFGLVGEPFVGR
ncbi:MAG TPA: biopolymer transporter ExbD [Longimicrobiales bacterium]|nr:biopolymer transporter ExbD [Longimicrobiales bacterium]